MKERKATTAKRGGGKARAAKPKETRKCGCGCGGLTKGGEFLPGHDMRLKGKLRKAAEKGSSEAKAELRRRGW